MRCTHRPGRRRRADPARWSPHAQGAPSNGGRGIDNNVRKRARYRAVCCFGSGASCTSTVPRVATQTNNDFLIGACDRGNQDNVACAVTFREPPELLVAQLPFRKEEPPIDRFRLQRPKRFRYASPIVGAHGADRYAAQVRTTRHGEAVSRARITQRISRLAAVVHLLTF